MSKKFLTNIQLNQNQILSGVFEKLASAPVSPVTGQFYYNTVDDKFYGWNGTTWKDLGFDTPGGGPVTFNSIINPPQITANTDNWNPTGLSTCNVIRASTDAARDLTGIVAQPSGTTIILLNVGTVGGAGGASLKLKKYDAGSSLGNRFLIRADATLEVDEGCIIWYDNSGASFGAQVGWRIGSRF